MRLASGSIASIGMVGEYQAHSGRVRRLCSVKDPAGLLVSCADDATIAITQIGSEIDGVETKTTFNEKTRFSIHKDYVTDLAVIEQDGLTILSASSDKTVKISKYPVE
eukprot:gene29598-36673_t